MPEDLRRRVVEDGAYDRFPRQVQQMVIDNVCEFTVEMSSPEFFTPVS
jgi:hypothetical protein